MVCLQGLVPEMSIGSVVAVFSASVVDTTFPPAGLPPKIQQLLVAFLDVFGKPSGLPPSYPGIGS